MISKNSRFNTEFSRSLQYLLFWAKISPISYTVIFLCLLLYYFPICRWIIVKVFLFLVRLFNIFNEFLLSSIVATCIAKLKLLDLMILTIRRLANLLSGHVLAYWSGSPESDSRLSSWELFPETYGYFCPSFSFVHVLCSLRKKSLPSTDYRSWEAHQLCPCSYMCSMEISLTLTGRHMVYMENGIRRIY